MSSATYTVKTPVFEGPLDLLLTLIEKRKVFVSDIALADVAEDFISYIKSHPEIPVDESAEFLIVASTLVLIKSKSLLPNMKLTSEEEESIDDLERRLKLYEKFREISGTIKELFGVNRIFTPSHNIPPVRVFAPSEEMRVPNLYTAIQDVINNLPEQAAKNPEVKVKKVISLDEMMSRLSTRIERAMKLSFKEFTGNSTEKVNIIVSFLALLELMKQGHIDAQQEGDFSDISIESQNINTPRYL